MRSSYFSTLPIDVVVVLAAAESCGIRLTDGTCLWITPNAFAKRHGVLPIDSTSRGKRSEMIIIVVVVVVVISFEWKRKWRYLAGRRLAIWREHFEIESGNLGLPMPSLIARGMTMTMTMRSEMRSASRLLTFTDLSSAIGTATMTAY
jgi:hypothetical protein